MFEAYRFREGKRRIDPVVRDGNVANSVEENDGVESDDEPFSAWSPSQVDSEEMYLPLNPGDISGQNISGAQPPEPTSIVTATTGEKLTVDLEADYVMVEDELPLPRKINSLNSTTPLRVQEPVTEKKSAASKKRKELIEEALRGMVSGGLNAANGEDVLGETLPPVVLSPKRRRQVSEKTPFVENDDRSETASSSNLQPLLPNASSLAKRGARTKTRTAKAIAARSDQSGKGKARAV